MDGITFRDATAADTTFLVNLARDAYSDVLARQFDGWVESVHGVRFAEKVTEAPFQVVELNGVPVGTVSTIVSPDHLRVNELVVSPGVQGKGIGAYVLRREMDRAAKRGVPVRLHTFTQNRARAFYERHGFVVTGERPDELDMEWPAPS